MRPKLPSEMTRLDDIARSLAETNSIKEVKSLRDKAEAARKYAQSAALSLRIQNQAAELKLCAERRAGELLNELATHGGDRKSSSHGGNLKLSDLGINPNQSARWRREAAVPEEVFRKYIVTANELGRDISAQELLRIERRLIQKQEAHSGQTSGLTDSITGCSDFRTVHSQSNPEGSLRNDLAPHRALRSTGSTGDLPRELLNELKNHRNLLAAILKPVCDRKDAVLKLSERRMVARLLADFEQILVRLE